MKNNFKKNGGKMNKEAFVATTLTMYEELSEGHVLHRQASFDEIAQQVTDPHLPVGLEASREIGKAKN